MRSMFAQMTKRCLSPMIIGLFALILSPYASAEEVDAADESEFRVEQRGEIDIEIDANLDDWRLAGRTLFMGEDTWEPYQGGNWDDEDDLTATLKVAYDADNLYFGLLVKDDEYVAEAANPWENDGVQIAINSVTDQFPPPAGITGDTHLYNFSIVNGWQMEAGSFLGNAEIEMERNEDRKETIFEWRMPAEIIGGKGETFEPGRKIAFAIIVNDSDLDASGQKGWVGWGNQTIVFGKNPEEMQTLVLSSEMMPVEAAGKLLTTWGALRQQ